MLSFAGVLYLIKTLQVFSGFSFPKTQKQLSFEKFYLKKLILEYKKFSPGAIFL